MTLTIDELGARLRAVRVNVRPDRLAALDDAGRAEAERLLLELEAEAAGDADDLAFAWDDRVRELPRTGPPGVSYARVEALAGTVQLPGEPDVEVYATIDVVTYRNSRGRVLGILYHYPDTITLAGMVLEEAGNVNLIVDPRRRRRGIGTALLDEADRRFAVDYARQKFTHAGRAFVTATGRLPATMAP